MTDNLENTLLVWTDLETDGHNVPVGVPLEIGVVVTDWKLNILDMFEALVLPEPHEPGVPDLINEMPEVVYQMHRKSGLLDDLTDATIKTFRAFHYQVDSQVSAWLRRVAIWYTHEYELGPVGSWESNLKLTLAGSGVSHFDHLFLKRYFPKFWSLLDGYTKDSKPSVDIGTLRRFVKLTGLSDRLAVPEGYAKEAESLPHRALPDVMEIIAQARWYHERLKEIKPLV